MPTYQVNVTGTAYWEVEVEADSEDEAVKEALNVAAESDPDEVEATTISTIAKVEE